MKAVILHPSFAIVFAVILQLGAWIFGGGAILILIVAPGELSALKTFSQIVSAACMQAGSTWLLFSVVQEKMIDELLRRAGNE